jgi:hypothetical protein
MRVWPKMVTSSEEKIETTAVAATTVPGQLAPTRFCRIAASPADWPSNRSASWAPRAPRATSRYTAVMMTSDHSRASGRVRVGFLASSPAVATASSPTKEKKISPAPAITPATPKGAKSAKRSDSQPVKATARRRSGRPPS